MRDDGLNSASRSRSVAGDELRELPEKAQLETLSAALDDAAEMSPGCERSVYELTGLSARGRP